MENPLFAFLGIIIITAISYDAIQTTLSASNSGPITNRLVSTAWFMLLYSHRRHERHWLLAAAGPWVTLSLVLVWVGLAWLGWWLVFLSDPHAVVDAISGEQASLVERGYFLGYTVTTLGYGDFVPGAGCWQLIAILAAGNGLILFTLAVTYIVSVVSAVTQKRRLALAISSLGSTPEAIVTNTIGDGDFSGLGEYASKLQGDILSVSQEHLAYPILHYYHERDPSGALPVQLARLYQVLLSLQHAGFGLPPTVRLQLQTTIYAIEKFLETLERGFVQPASYAPEIPESPFFHSDGFEIPASELREHLASQRSQRLLSAYIHKDGWCWDIVW